MTRGRMMTLIRKRNTLAVRRASRRVTLNWRLRTFRTRRRLRRLHLFAPAPAGPAVARGRGVAGDARPAARRAPAHVRRAQAARRFGRERGGAAVVGFRVGTICVWRVWRVWRVRRRNEREAALVFRVKRRDSRGDDDGLRRDCRAAGTRDERRRRDERGTRARFRSVRNVFGGANAFRGARFGTKRFGTKRARRGGRLARIPARHDTRGGGPVPVTRAENAAFVLGAPIC